MSQCDIIQITFDNFMKSVGFSKKSGSWYQAGADVLMVANLQKSQYGKQYYINLALWLTQLGEGVFPKVHTCHVITRLSRLVGDGEFELARLLDLEESSVDENRTVYLEDFFRTYMMPFFDLASSVQSLRSPAGSSLTGSSLVTGPAQEILGT